MDEEENKQRFEKEMKERKRKEELKRLQNVQELGMESKMRRLAELKLDAFYRASQSARLREAWKNDPEFRKAMIDAELIMPREELFDEFGNAGVEEMKGDVPADPRLQKIFEAARANQNMRSGPVIHLGHDKPRSDVRRGK
jgi:hypothetical protein